MESVAKVVSAKRAGLMFSRRFTVKGKNPLDQVEYERRDSVITEPDGSVVFEMRGVEVPKEWSQLATDIVVSKYFRKAGVPGTGSETSVRQVVFRIADSIRLFGEEHGYFGSRDDADTFEAELAYLLVHQYGAFNSPVWFNCGLFHQYGITRSGGNWFWDTDAKAISMTNDSYSHPQCSACFIQSIEDDLMKIFDLVKNEAHLFKFGSGTGSNFSTLRSKYEKLSSGGTSSGLMAFLEVLDRAAGSLKSGGTTRRAAKMVCLDMDHPEILDFIRWKMNEEKKARVLIDAGYPSDFNGEAYHTVSGQNANNSVRLSDTFMNAVLTGGEWETRFRTTGETHAVYTARDLMDEICKAAWACADPGVQFDTIINDWHTCPASGPIRASNPCSEFMFLDDTACNLASLNLLKFAREDGSFDVEAYHHAIRVFFVAQEILVDFSSYPTHSIAKNSHEFRPLGLGYANLGTLLMINGIPYDSDRARAWASAITAITAGYAYQVSAEIASSLGPFVGFEKNREPCLRVMRKHRDCAYKIDIRHCPKDLLDACRQDWDDCVKIGERFGFRNAQATVLAPTGTIGLLMDCDTTGVEPDFALVKFKKLAGGGYFTIINQALPRALAKLGYSPDQIKDISSYILGSAQNPGTLTMEGAPHLKEEHLSVFDCANKCGSGVRFIDPMGHIKVMAAVQPFISGAISKTVNLPNEATVQDIEKIYVEAWKLGLKAVALYRDGCKLSQPLSSGIQKGEKASFESKGESAIAVKARVLLPKRSGLTHEASVAGHKVVLRTGEFPDGALGEVIISSGKEGSTLHALMDALSQAVSLGLQHGIPLERFVDRLTFSRFDPQGITTHPNVKSCTSVVDFVFRVLAMEYLGRMDLVQVKPESTRLESLKNDHNPGLAAGKGMEGSSFPKSLSRESVSVHPQKADGQLSDDLSTHLSEMMGDAPACNQCGHITVRNASCYRCLNCGNSMGCS